jgi:hypothetical protein
MMFRKITSFVVALSVLLLMQFAECQAMPREERAMKCCRAVPCNPPNQRHDCCVNMVTGRTASVLQSLHVPLAKPVAVPAGPLPVTEIRRGPGNILAPTSQVNNNGSFVSFQLFTSPKIWNTDFSHSKSFHQPIREKTCAMELLRSA